ncbi:MAG: ATP-dependent Clp protease ATP-binding subunit [Acidobacteria bacterium]|nr:MAG: ATP-dependent Clp protease ATP-binding subunit [Acidobacteriota bacterium]
MVRLNQQLLDPTRSGREAEQLETSLRSKIIGQDQAIRQIVSVYQTFLAGMNSPGRPVGNFLFLGPTGTGKTRMVEATAESLVGDARAVIKIDCAEFQHSHEIAKLIGSPPGYLGHRETHPALGQDALNRYHTENLKLSFVLFDEIEKASDALWNLLLGVLDKGTLTLGDNRQVDFSRCIIFMTSNLGASEMASILKPGLGFAPPPDSSEPVPASLAEKVSRAGMEAARRKFSPEFINRIDKIVAFQPLDESELRRVLDLELGVLRRRFADSSQGTPFVLSVTGRAKGYLLQEGTDVRYGARPLKRAIERSLVHPMSSLIATGQVRLGDWIRVDFDPELRHLTFYKDAEDVALAEMAALASASTEQPAPAMAVVAPAQSSRAAKVRSIRSI